MALERDKKGHPAINELVDRYAQDDPHVKKLLRESTRTLRKMTEDPQAKQSKTLRLSPSVNHPDIITPVPEFNNRTPRKILEFAIQEEIKGPKKRFTPFEEIIESDETKSTKYDLVKAKRKAIIYEKPPKKERKQAPKKKSIDTPTPKITTEEEWYNRIQDASFGDGLAWIFQEQNISNKAFEKKADVSRSQLIKIKHEHCTPGLPTVNEIISKLNFDSQGKAAQLLRLKSQKKEAMSVNALQETNVGQLVRYVRITQGLTQDELGELLNRPQSTIGNIETKNRTPPGIDEDIFCWLGAEPINTIIQSKIYDKDAFINKDMLRDVLAGKILFAEAPPQEE